MRRMLIPLFAFFFAGCGGCTKPEARVIVYCAQDQEYAEGIFADFQKEHGLMIAPKFDTEANKSVSLVAELMQETNRPRCDVHWNNEILGTIRLARQGLYEPYVSPNASVYPEWSHGKSGLYQAFAERARVIIVNTNLVPEAERPASIFDMTLPKWKGRIAIAKPQFGTMATQAACLFEVLGTAAAKEYFRNLKANDVQIVPGNKQVARGVADGTIAFGLTDTDDAIIESIAGKPVAIIFPDSQGHAKHERFGTLFVPNTVAIVKGSPNPAGARKLVDYLLEPKTEEALAKQSGYQLPLNPALQNVAHPALKTRHQLKAMAVDYEKAADLWEEVQSFLRDEFSR